jgi:hypothetical protein
VDDDAPVISSVNYGSLQNDANQWCNLEKYKQIDRFEEK